MRFMNKLLSLRVRIIYRNIPGNKYADSISQDKIKKMTSYLFEYDVIFI